VILIDTTPLVALCDPRDGLSSRAIADLDRVAKTEIVLCEPVLTEACFLLSHPVQRARLQRLVIEIGMSPLAIEDEKELRREVFGWLARYSEHEPDWADGYLAVLSGRQKGARVWTYDREFRTTWRRLDGTRIPLAIR
jgi:predicted nucleic acid-binding protein